MIHSRARGSMCRCAIPALRRPGPAPARSKEAGRWARPLETYRYGFLIRLTAGDCLASEVATAPRVQGPLEDRADSPILAAHDQLPHIRARPRNCDATGSVGRVEEQGRPTQRTGGTGAEGELIEETVLVRPSAQDGAAAVIT